MQWNKKRKLFCVTNSYHLNTNEREEVALCGHISCTTSRCKCHHDYKVPELFPFFFLQLLLPGNSQNLGLLGAPGCWSLRARVSDASPAARASEGEGVHYPQILLLEDLPVYSQLWEFALLGFMRLFTCLILSRCFEVLLTQSCTMT